MPRSTDAETAPMLSEYIIDKHDNGLGDRPASRRGWLRRARVLLPNLRWPLVLTLQLFIVYLLLHGQASKEAFQDPGADINGIVPKLSYTTVRFKPRLDEYTANYTSAQQSREVWERWTNLLPLGGGTVRIDEHADYRQLGVPFSDPEKTLGPLYQVSWTHQLHCLYYLMDAYDRLVRLGPTGTESKIPHGSHSVHTNHCVDYLRQAILCTADMTLEGGVPGEERGTNGFGHAHVCRDYREAVEWIESRRISDERHVVAH